MAARPVKGRAVPASHDIVVLGAGVLGACTAARLALSGREVTLVDPGGDNASSIAAGMIAPAMESLLDGADAGRARLLRAARDLWPDFAAGTGVDLHRDGAVWRGADAPARAVALRALGFEAVERAGEMFTPDDWRIDPEPALATLTATAGVHRRKGRASRLAPGSGGWALHLEDGDVLTAAAVVVAVGVARLQGPAALEKVLDRVAPIRGQLVRAGLKGPDGVVRGPGVYAAPRRDGLVFGASMEPGVRDLTPDPVAGRAMAQAGAGLVGRELSDVDIDCRVGLRGASPDGLPLAGAIADGLIVALAPRRNGWLLGPAVAGVAAAGAGRRPPDAWAATFDPFRFD